MAKLMSTSNKPHIPVEILTNILTRLPVKYLVRLKAVCKSWLALITSNDFVKLHLHTSSQSPYPEDRTLVFASKDKALYSASLDSHYRAVKLELEGLTTITTFIGSCNGLILCAQCDYPNYKCVALFLVNPSTSQCKRLPIDSLSCDTDWNQCFGFGYDHVTDDYKVVYFRYNYHYDNVVGDDFDGKMVYVYSLKANFWKKINNDTTGVPPPDLEFCSMTGVLMNNNLLHWRCMNTSRRYYHDYLRVISFDVTTEKWSKVPLPRNPLLDTRLISEISIDGVGVQGGRLCVMSRVLNPEHGYGVDVWVMKEYGVQESWVKLFKCTEGMCATWSLRFATISFAQEGDDDEIWLTTIDQESNMLKWYGVRGNKSGEARILGVPNFALFTACTRSLVKLPQTS